MKDYDYEYSDKFYKKMLNDSDVSKLKFWQQKIILEGLRRIRCLGEASKVNIPQDIDEDCIEYAGRYLHILTLKLRR